MSVLIELVSGAYLLWALYEFGAWQNLFLPWLRWLQSRIVATMRAVNQALDYLDLAIADQLL